MHVIIGKRFKGNDSSVYILKVFKMADI